MPLRVRGHLGPPGVGHLRERLLVRRRRHPRQFLGPDQPARFQRSVWRRIDLTRADLRWTQFEGDFDGVDFSGAKFTQTTWGWSNLVDLVFSGIVKGLTIGRLPVDRQPADWVLKRVDFRV